MLSLDTCVSSCSPLSTEVSGFSVSVLLCIVLGSSSSLSLPVVEDCDSSSMACSVLSRAGLAVAVSIVTSPAGSGTTVTMVTVVPDPAGDAVCREPLVPAGPDD